MNLNDLTPTERMSLVGGQMCAAMQELENFSKKEVTDRISKDVENFLGGLRNRLNRILDLIEESNNIGGLK